MVLGRLNHQGSRFVGGTEVVAFSCGLLQTADLRGVELRACLREAALAGIAVPGTVTLPASPLN